MESLIHSSNKYLDLPGPKKKKKIGKKGGDCVLVRALSLKMRSLRKSFIIPGLVFLFLYHEKCSLDDVLVRNISVVTNGNPLYLV